MSRNNEVLLGRAKQAIRDLFNDKSVSRSAAVMNLGELKDEIEILIDALASEQEVEADAGPSSPSTE